MMIFLPDACDTAVWQDRTASPLVDGAGATQAGAAAELCAGHPQMLADDPQQGRVTRYVDRMIMPIDVQGDHTPSDGGFLAAPRSAASQFHDVAESGGPALCAAMCGPLRPAFDRPVGYS